WSGAKWYTSPARQAHRCANTRVANWRNAYSNRYSSSPRHRERMAMRQMLGLLFTLLVAGCDQQETQKTETPRPVIVFRVASADVIAGRAFPEYARSAREAMLSFRVAGRIQERRVKTGDQVKKGDILATLDAAPYQTEFDRVAA